MKPQIFCRAILCLIFGSTLPGLSSLMAQESPPEPILEKYFITGSRSEPVAVDGLKTKISDKFFGGGSAQAMILSSSKDGQTHLSLRVWRRVKAGGIAFALLVFRVEVRGYDDTNQLFYSCDLEGFTLGDSNSGKWSQILEDIPSALQRIEVTFIGNYE